MGTASDRGAVSHIPEGDYGGVPWEQVAGTGRPVEVDVVMVSVFFGLGLTRHGLPHANVEALLRLVTDLNAHTRFVARRMRVPGDVAGADSVLSLADRLSVQCESRARLSAVQSGRVHGQ